MPAAAPPLRPPKRPSRSAARPSRITIADVVSRRRLTRLTLGASASRIASSGCTCVARRAGTKPETTVAIMPTSRPTMIVRGSITVPVEGSSRPNDASIARRPGARSRPPRMPTTDATKPMISVSAITELSTCRREAPSVRSSANSRERCATVTANVLKIRKPPTNTAMPAKISSAVVRKPSDSLMSPACSSACSLPVRTTAVSPSAWLIRCLSCSGVVPSSAATTTSVILPGIWAICWTSESGIVSVPMPSESWSPILPMPTSV